MWFGVRVEGGIKEGDELVADPGWVHDDKVDSDQ